MNATQDIRRQGDCTCTIKQHKITNTHVVQQHARSINCQSRTCHRTRTHALCKPYT